LEKPSATGQPVSPVTIVNSLITDAVRKGASDIHIEPGKDRVKVRYRIDGRMIYVAPLINTLLPGIVARVKIMCNMDVAECRKPQDGGCLTPVDGRDIEIRASTLPGNHGEIVVLRILYRDEGLQKLDALGLLPANLRDFHKLLSARQGMLLITGPTGSGKTTTLYAGLSHLNTEEVNIITVEDPIEVDLDGVNQVQIHERAGRSYASTLRAMLRQDPDILMVGEIRDLETAEIACRAALTGHLVLSTLHTQDTLGTLARLFDMGIPPYLVASSLNGVVAQRLVLRVCDGCAADYTPSASVRRTLESQFGSLEGAHLRKGRGCAKCHQTGTRGRIGVFELLLIDEDMRHFMSEGVNPSLMREYVQKRGFIRMEEDAFRKACLGLVPPDEIVNLGLGVDLSFDDTCDRPEAAAEPPTPVAHGTRQMLVS
jgi:type II secretory ATPase GspE/PulE/Tfp pilus assembly ATPase PilB-like protein